MSQRLSYASAGVDIDQTDAAKREMAKSMETNDPRVLNRIGAFATLIDASFPGIAHPVLVHKSEEPGSKQKLAFAHGRHRSVCYDMVNHLIDDIIVMGAAPISIQDVIVCGSMDGDLVNDLVDAMADACRQQDCVLTGGETSVQPGVIPDGLYVLTASILGVVDKEIVSAEEIRRLAKLPPRDHLLAEIAGAFEAPMVAFASALEAKIQEISGLFEALRDKQAAEPTAEASSEEQEAEASEEAPEAIEEAGEGDQIIGHTEEKQDP